MLNMHDMECCEEALKALNLLQVARVKRSPVVLDKENTGGSKRLSINPRAEGLQ